MKNMIANISSLSTLLLLSACQTVSMDTTKTINDSFQITSSDIAENTPFKKAQEFNGFGCSGSNLSPQLAWKNVPKGTKSFAVTIYDLDAPTGSGWWHWTAVNIPNTVSRLKTGEKFANMPAVVQGRTDYGSSQFGGACPPVGDKTHRYEVKVWALDVVKLPNVTKDSSGALIGYFLNKHKLSSAKITALYQR